MYSCIILTNNTLAVKTKADTLACLLLFIGYRNWWCNWSCCSWHCHLKNTDHHRFVGAKLHLC